MRILENKSERRTLSVAVLLLLLSACLSAIVIPTASQATASQASSVSQPKPAPARWLGLIGEYGPDDDTVIILEQDGRLSASFKRAKPEPLEEVSKDVFKFPAPGPHALQQLIFARDPRGRATQVAVDAIILKRRIKPLRPVAELMKEALAAQPPKETGEFRETDLVELMKLDPTIRLEVRYATTNNFLGTVFYSEARAFMQRPAAEAVVRANKKLKQYGYGLLIHDAYRPWYVTKVFWDATPDDKKVFVANPANGSRHNRGCAVDLTLYDLKTKKPVEMVSTYDETTARAYPDYPGGTSLQRWHRNYLRDAMAAEGFTVYEAEWWHFDYKDWKQYRIGNVAFDRIQSNSR
jgi:D-alanyl-D-alanine dipeptidase